MQVFVRTIKIIDLYSSSEKFVRKINFALFGENMVHSTHLLLFQKCFQTKYRPNKLVLIRVVRVLDKIFFCTRKYKYSRSIYRATIEYSNFSDCYSAIV